MFSRHGQEQPLLDNAYSWRLLNDLVPLLFAKLLRGYSDKAVFTGGGRQHAEG